MVFHKKPSKISDHFKPAGAPTPAPPSTVLVPTCNVDLMAFPPEIRDNIYECIVTEPNVILTTCAGNALTPRFHSSSMKNRNVHDLNIFRVSKQVFLESRRIFFSRNVFEVNLIDDGEKLRYNFVPTEDYAIKALRHIKICVHLSHSPSQEQVTARTLRHILERATDLRTLEIWMNAPAYPRPYVKKVLDEEVIFQALAQARNLRRLKIVLSPDVVRLHGQQFGGAFLLSLLRTKMLANSHKAVQNPVWAAFETVYSTVMCHDTWKGECLLTKDDRRYLEAPEVHEFLAEDDFSRGRRKAGI